jgi:hypothetical protein
VFCHSLLKMNWSKSCLQTSSIERENQLQIASVWDCVMEFPSPWIWVSHPSWTRALHVIWWHSFTFLIGRTVRFKTEAIKHRVSGERERDGYCHPFAFTESSNGEEKATLTSVQQGWDLMQVEESGKLDWVLKYEKI